LTVALFAPEDLIIQSHTGQYRVRLVDGVLGTLADASPTETIAIVDDRVADLYSDALEPVLARASTLRIIAEEPNKSLERMPDYVDHLVAHGVRRGQVLLAIGGGIIQDIVCFLAATLLRGMTWRFVPTTLLAQSDSCIGSKSSINVRAAKNVVGTFTPPSEVLIDVGLLETLEPDEVRSGIGEMLKVHAVAGPERFDEIAADYDALVGFRRDPAVLASYIARSLSFKQRLVEADEFDRGPRLVMNYGHSFGHAIESATAYSIPHGIAITIGMDMANRVAQRLGLGTEEHYVRMNPVLAANYSGYDATEVPLDRFFSAIASDKKNTASQLRLVLPDEHGTIRLIGVTADDVFRDACTAYLRDGRTP
jgi:3-dehydroquinate synthase